LLATPQNGGVKVTVDGTWLAWVDDYGEVILETSEATRRLDKDHPEWRTLVDSVALHDEITAAFRARAK
jgi:hypothetical protein